MGWFDWRLEIACGGPIDLFVCYWGRTSEPIDIAPYLITHYTNQVGELLGASKDKLLALIEEHK